MDTRTNSELELIYCAGGNLEYSRVAMEEGYTLGSRSDYHWYNELPMQFADVEYRNPNFEKHLAFVKKYRPRFAIVPDLSELEVSQEDIDRVIEQAEQVKQYCDFVMVVPKLSGQIAMLPDWLVIGYSIPTSNGGAQYLLFELAGRMVHLLGGSPHSQMKHYRHIQAIADVVSVDGSMAKKMALQYKKYWAQVPGYWVRGDGNTTALDCWRLSCRNIKTAWASMVTVRAA